LADSFILGFLITFLTLCFPTLLTDLALGRFPKPFFWVALPLPRLRLPVGELNLELVFGFTIFGFTIFGFTALDRLADATALGGDFEITFGLTPPSDPTFPPIFALIFGFNPFNAPAFTFFFPLQKLLKPFFKHCMPFRMANCLALAAAAFFNPAAPPVFAIAATFKPIFAIFINRLNLLRSNLLLGTIYTPFDLFKIELGLFSCGVA
jgi:hypothetical protein